MANQGGVKRSGFMDRIKSAMTSSREKKRLDTVRREAQADIVMGRQSKAVSDELNQMHDAGKARKGVARSERDLSSYLIKRSVQNKPVEGSQLSALRLGNQSLNETRAKLSKGRGNVDTDIKKTKHGSSRRTVIGRELTKEFTNSSMSPDRRGRISSSVSELTRAGNCGEHATLATHVHAGKLTGDQTVNRVKHADVDHAWSEVRMKPGGTSSDVVLDAWGKGSAVLREDSEFAKDVRKVKSIYSYDSTTGPAASRNQQAIATKLKSDPDMQGRVDTRLKTLNKEKFKYSDKSVWSPTPVASKEFTKGAIEKRTALDKKNPVLHDILAAGVARNLGANVKQASAFAEKASKDK